MQLNIRQKLKSHDGIGGARDHLAHPLYGEQKKTNAFLLRLTQPSPSPSKDGSGGAEQPSVRAQVVARVMSSYR
jgi:hypothetical protein